jgi:hypothetical protein
MVIGGIQYDRGHRLGSYGFDQGCRVDLAAAGINDEVALTTPYNPDIAHRVGIDMRFPQQQDIALEGCD